MRTARAYMFYALKKMGMCARAPHAFLPMLLCDKVPSERAIALKFGIELLERSDVLLVCGNRISNGMKSEIANAAMLRMCDCTNSHIGQIENARGIPSLEMTVRIANSLEVTVDQLISTSYASPEKVFLKEVLERIEKYPLKKRIKACEGLITYLDTLEKFGE